MEIGNEETVKHTRGGNSVFSYKGRLRRRDYALLLIASVVMLAVSYVGLIWVIVADGGDDGANLVAFVPLLYLVALALVAFICLQTAKRLHDIGWSGWFCLVPYIQLPLLFIEGERGENRYGAAPKVRGLEVSDEDLVNDPARMFMRPFSFRGRIRRTEYTISVVLQLVGVVALAVLCFLQLDAAINGGGEWALAITACVASGLLLVPILWFSLAQEAKRLHDVGLSGWFCLSPIFWLALLFVPGVNETNRWGSRPKRGENQIPQSWEVAHDDGQRPRMFRNPFSFRGRIRRTEYAISMIVLWAGLYVGVVLMALFVVLAVRQSEMEEWQQAVVVLLMMLPVLVVGGWLYLAQTAKRLHDIDVQGMFCLSVGIWFALVFVEGTKGANRYGASPKGEVESTAEEPSEPEGL